MNKQLMLKNIFKKIHNKSGIDTYVIFQKLSKNFYKLYTFFGYILFWLTWGGGGAIPDGSSRESWLAMLLLKRKCKKINNANNIMLYSNSLSLSNKKKFKIIRSLPFGLDIFKLVNLFISEDTCSRWYKKVIKMKTFYKL